MVTRYLIAYRPNGTKKLIAVRKDVFPILNSNDYWVNGFPEADSYVVKRTVVKTRDGNQNIINASVVYETKGNLSLCQHCLEDTSSRETRVVDLNSVRGDICLPHWQVDNFSCMCCNVPNSRENAFELGNRIVCASCYQTRGRTCEECNDRDYEGDMRNVRGINLCNQCYTNRAYESHDIKPHCYKPKPKWKTEEGEAAGQFHKHIVFYGLEIEMDRDEEYPREEVTTISRMVASKAPEVYMKEDGSIRHGFEIVSHPMTQRYAKKKFDSQTMFAVAKSNGMRAKDNCGLHIHVSLTALSPIEWWKAASFFEKCKEQVAIVSRRLPENLERWANIPSVGRNALNKEKIKKHPVWGRMNNRHERYAAMNFTKKTCEFRIFAGVQERETLNAAIDFVASVIEFARNHGMAFINRNDSKTVWQAYITHAKESNQHLYRHMRKLKVA